MLRSFAIVLVLVPLFVASPAAAQIVNIQPLLGPATADGFSLELTGSAELKTGNVDLFVGKAGLGTNFVIAYDREPPPAVEALDTSLMATITVSL